MRIMYAIGIKSRMLDTAAKRAGAMAFSSSGVSDDVNRMFISVSSFELIRTFKQAQHPYLATEWFVPC